MTSSAYLAGSTGDDASDQHVVELLSDRSKCCWVCSVPLEMGDGEFCWYTRYDHPLFPPVLERENHQSEGAKQPQKVLVASVCAACAPYLVDHNNGVMAFSVQKPPGEEDDDDGCNDFNDLCALCLMPAPSFFECDCDQCPLLFCETCIAACHGGGDRGWKTMLEQRESKDKLCPVCHPPPTLYEAMPFRHTPARTFDIACWELAVAYSEHETTLEKLHQQDVLRQTIAAELATGNSTACESDVEGEMGIWRDSMARHEIRLLDTISRLHCEINNYGYSLINWEPVESNKEWVRNADKEVCARHLAMRKEARDLRLTKKICDAKICYKDVEELRSTVRCEDATEEEIKDALKGERKKLKELQVEMTKVSERRDVQLENCKCNAFRCQIRSRCSHNKNRCYIQAITLSNKFSHCKMSDSDHEHGVHDSEAEQTQDPKGMQTKYAKVIKHQNDAAHDERSEVVPDQDEQWVDNYSKERPQMLGVPRVTREALGLATIHPTPTMTLSPSTTSQEGDKGNSSSCTKTKGKKRVPLQQVKRPEKSQHWPPNKDPLGGARKRQESREMFVHSNTPKQKRALPEDVEVIDLCDHETKVPEECKQADNKEVIDLTSTLTVAKTKAKEQAVLQPNERPGTSQEAWPLNSDAPCGAHKRPASEKTVVQKPKISWSNKNSDWITAMVHSKHKLPSNSPAKELKRARLEHVPVIDLREDDTLSTRIMPTTNKMKVIDLSNA
ncbi:hypothetical protein ACA910_018815 [Epithemia clementina (nom. ined.)]